MARPNSDVAVDFHKSSKRPSRSKLKRSLLLGALLLFGAIVVAPSVLLSASLVNWVIASFGGLAPLTVKIGSVEAGWFKAVTAGDIQLINESGQPIAKVSSVTTEKGLLAWITSPTELGTIRVDGTVATIVASAGTTNVEQALAGILKPESAPDQSDEARSDKMSSGKIEITNTKLLLSELGRPEQWVVEVPTLRTELPQENQLFGPIELIARIGDASGTCPGGTGEVIANAQQSADGSIQLTAKMTQIPLDVLHVVRARVPDISVEQLTGRVSGTLAGVAANADKFTFELQQIQVQNLAIQAPTIVGPSPARLNGIVAAGRLSLADQLIKVENTELTCDFGRIQAAAHIPWPMPTPSLANPLLAGANFQAVGQVDLPKLITAAQSLVPMRPDTQLRAGQLQFSLSQQSTSAGPVSAQANVQLSGLEAMAAGQQIRWNDPVTVELSATQQSTRGTQFGIAALAEFCNLKGQGTIENGLLEGSLDLAMMHQRLSQFVDLPVNSMTGKAQMNMGWRMDANQLVAAKGQLATTPLVISTATGGQMMEPAWQGSFDASMQLRDGTPTSINKLHLELLATDEQVNIDLHEPLQLVANSEQGALSQSAVPAPFDIAISGKLANWKHRAMVWISQPPDMEIEGAIKLAVSGKLDRQHAEILQANWNIDSLKLQMSDLGFAEPQVIGKFNGKVDTSDLTKLQVDQLTVQASSFSLLAKDEAANNNTRRGQANFVVDLQRLLTNVNSVKPSGTQADATQYSATGQVQGGLAWAVNSTGAEFRFQASGKELDLNSRTPPANVATSLWSETQLVVNADGRWVAASGDINIDPMKMQTPWINYQGNLGLHTTEKSQLLNIVGQAVYDANQLSQKIIPLVGNNLQLVGQQTMPIEIQWHRNTTDTTAPALAGLKASARFGWDQARVVGIEVGKANVPVHVVDGKLTTAAEIPVSGGVLRWDLLSDLTSPELVIQQKPMTVLENVAITKEMCSGWLKYVAPLVAETTSINGRLSLALQRAEFTPADLTKQTVEGQLMMHNAEVGPGPLSNEVIGIVKQIEQIRKSDITQPVSSQNKVWLQLPQQQISFAMINGQVQHRDLRMDIGDATITTTGSVDVGGRLQLLASMPLPDKWTDRGLMSALRGQSLQFPVGGTVTQPQLDTSALRQLGRQTVESAAQNLLQQQLNKGLEKIFKLP